MRRTLFVLLAVSALLVLSLAQPAVAQFGVISTPPSGDNQHSIVTQYVGPVMISVDYHSPNVHAPDGTDRHGKIWGTLVPWGMANLGFGTCGDQCPWRGGANENTVFTVSHDVKVQGQALKAGSYGLHFLPGQTEWTIIFSKNSTAWGSFFYDVKDDALRVTAQPDKSEYHEWLTYEFTDRETDHATVAMKWEDLQLPFIVTVENIPDLYVAKITKELENSAGFTWQMWDAAAQYCLTSKSHMDLGMKWAQKAVNDPAVGQENFTTLSTLSMVQEASGQAAEAKTTMDRALNHRTASPLDIHFFARQLLGQKKTDEAVRVFELNAKRYPGVWPTEVGLTRAYSAKGNFKEALKHAKIALTQAPDDNNRKNTQTLISTLEQGKDVNQ